MACRSVVKFWGQGQSGQPIKLFQAPQKISFTSHYWHKFFARWWCETSRSNNSFKWKNVTDFWGEGRGRGVKTYSEPSDIFSGPIPNPRIYAPDWLTDWRIELNRLADRLVDVKAYKSRVLAIIIINIRSWTANRRRECGPASTVPDLLQSASRQDVVARWRHCRDMVKRTCLVTKPSR